MRSKSFTIFATSLSLLAAVLPGCGDDSGCAETATCPPSDADSRDVRSDAASRDGGNTDVATSDARSDSPAEASLSDVTSEANRDMRADSLPDASPDARFDASVDA